MLRYGINNIIVICYELIKYVVFYFNFVFLFLMLDVDVVIYTESVLMLLTIKRYTLIKNGINIINQTNSQKNEVCNIFLFSLSKTLVTF